MPGKKRNKKDLYEHAKKHLLLLSEYNDLSENYLQELQNNLLRGNFENAMNSYQDYLKKSGEIYGKAFEHHAKGLQMSPKLVHQIVDSHRDYFLQGMKNLESLQEHWDEFQKEPARKWKSQTSKWATNLAYTTALGLMATLPTLQSAQASAIEIMRPFEDRTRLDRPLHVVRPKIHLAPLELKGEEKEQFGKQLQQINKIINNFLASVQMSPLPKTSFSMIQHESKELQEAIWNSLKESTPKKTQKPKEASDVFKEALQSSKGKLKSVQEAEKNHYAKSLKNKDGEVLQAELIETIKGLRHVPESEKNLYAKNLAEVSTDILKEEIVATIATLRTVSEDQKNQLAKSLGQREGRKDETASSAPQVTIAYLDMLKELKKRFSSGGESEKSTPVKSLNDISDKIYATPTGAYLKYHYPKKNLDQAVSLAVERLLKNVQKDQYSLRRLASEGIISALNENFSQVHKEVTDLVKMILANSVADEDYYTLYHGHGNSLRLYMDMLREAKSYETIMDLEQTNPMRDKSAKATVRTVKDVLSHYQQEAEDYAKANNTELFSDKRILGFNFAPDKINFIRDHVISLNVNLFGNLNTLAECTLFYFIDSFNISNPNAALVANLIKRISDPNLTADALNAKVKRYTDLYEKHMMNTGGNLMAIKIKKGKFGEEGEAVSSIDDIAFPSWMKGVPIWLDENSQKLATRGNNYNAVPILGYEHEGYVRPTMSSYLESLLNPEGFIDQYSHFTPDQVVTKRNRNQSLDRTQARLVIDPVTFNDGKSIKVAQYTRFSTPDAQKEEYLSELQKLMKEDIREYLSLIQAGTIKVSDKDRLHVLMTLVNEATRS